MENPASAPLFRPLHKLGPDRIPFYVSAKSQEMRILLHHKRCEPALIHMPRADRVDSHAIVMYAFPHLSEFGSPSAFKSVQIQPKKVATKSG